MLDFNNSNDFLMFLLDEVVINKTQSVFGSTALEWQLSCIVTYCTVTQTCCTTGFDGIKTVQSLVIGTGWYQSSLCSLCLVLCFYLFIFILVILFF